MRTLVIQQKMSFYGFQMDNYTLAVNNMSAFLSLYGENDYWGFAKLRDVVDYEDAIENRAREHLVVLASDLKQNSPEILNLTTYETEEFIMNCVYNTKPCDMTAYATDSGS